MKGFPKSESDKMFSSNFLSAFGQTLFYKFGGFRQGKTTFRD